MEVGVPSVIAAREGSPPRRARVTDSAPSSRIDSYQVSENRGSDDVTRATPSWRVRWSFLFRTAELSHLPRCRSEDPRLRRRSGRCIALLRHRGSSGQSKPALERLTLQQASVRLSSPGREHQSWWLMPWAVEVAGFGVIESGLRPSGRVPQCGAAAGGSDDLAEVVDPGGPRDRPLGEQIGRLSGRGVPHPRGEPNRPNRLFDTHH